MEIIVYILVGFLNGLFSSGAGQVLIFYLVYISKMDTKKARQMSLMIMPLISIPTFIYYFKKANLKLLDIFIVIIISLICGNVGNKVMKKMNQNILNLVSGLLLVVTVCISLWRLK